MVVMAALFLTTASLSRGQTAQSAAARNTDSPYSRLNTWSVFGEFPLDSHRIILGDAEERRTIAVGGEYARRLLLKSWWELDYFAQVRPLFLERDPALAGIRAVTTKQVLLRFSKPFRVVSLDRTRFLFMPGNVVAENFYTTEWTYAGGMNPLGFKWSLLPRRRMQPVLMATSGFVVSTRDIPIDATESFNFTFEFGAGLEYYFHPKHSVRIDYRVHHLSNAYRGFYNPGVDSNLFQLSYSFGR
jgi:hypothetical protein